MGLYKDKKYFHFPVFIFVICDVQNFLKQLAHKGTIFNVFQYFHKVPIFRLVRYFAHPMLHCSFR